MKVNSFLTDILKSPWLVHQEFIPQYESLFNRYISGEFKGEKIDREKFFAGLGSSDITPNCLSEEKKITTVPMRGILPAYGGMCTLGADDYLSIFRKLNENDKVGAVVLDIDGLGSSVSAINMMNEFKEEKKKPFVGLLNSCYSGHYWLASMLCDHLMSYGDISAGFGSIGVLSVVQDSRDAMKEMGYKVLVVRAPQSTTKAQQMVDFYNGEDEKFIKALEDEMEPMAEEFISAVKLNRPNINQNLEGLFTGSTYNAKIALKNKVIDSIGNEKKAIERAKILMELYNN